MIILEKEKIMSCYGVSLYNVLLQLRACLFSIDRWMGGWMDE